MTPPWPNWPWVPAPGGVLLGYDGLDMPARRETHIGDVFVLVGALPVPSATEFASDFVADAVRIQWLALTT